MLVLINEQEYKKTLSYVDAGLAFYVGISLRDIFRTKCHERLYGLVTRLKYGQAFIIMDPKFPPYSIRSPN